MFRSWAETFQKLKRIAFIWNSLQNIFGRKTGFIIIFDEPGNVEVKMKVIKKSAFLGEIPLQKPKSFRPKIFCREFHMNAMRLSFWNVSAHDLNINF